jgi:phosphotriesterase-related protein
MLEVETIGDRSTCRSSELMHEHVFVLTPEIQTAYPGFEGWDPAKQVDRRAEAQGAKHLGVDTIVDLTVVGPAAT